MAEVGHGASVATFEDTLNTISFSIPRIPLLASVAEELVVDRILGVDYWMRQLRESIPTSPLIERLQAHGYGVFLKAGSADNSRGIDEGTEHQEKAPLIVSSLKPDTDDQESILEALAGLYVRGVNIDWEAYYRGSGRRRIPLPTYPFERKRCWITPVEPPQEGRNRSLSKQEHNPKEKP